MADATDSKSVGGNPMRVRLSPRALVLACLLWVSGAHLASQQPALRGTVFSAETGQPLGFSIVTLVPNGGRQFTDAAGAFVFGITSGGYVLSVRQIGYTPLDTQIVVRGDSTTTVQVTLRHLAIELPPVTITARQCTNPGPPDSTETVLRAVFDQLQENARRFELLADSYPFRYRLERTVRTMNQHGDTGRSTVDTIRLTSGEEHDHPYAVGRVVEPAWGPWGDGGDGVYVIHSADLHDLGNPDFVASHCFRLAGRDTIGGERLVRINFEPATRIGSADMAGAAYLDSLTFELRYTETSLTRPERSALNNLRTVNFRTRFRSVAHNVSLQDVLTVITTYRFGQRPKIETQRTVEVRFSRQPPPP